MVDIRAKTKHYLMELNYHITYEDRDLLKLKHRKTMKEVAVVVGKIPEVDFIKDFDEKTKYIFAIAEEEVLGFGVDKVATYIEGLPKNVSLTIVADDSLEHWMKDIWFFLNR